MYETRTNGWLNYLLSGILALLMGWVATGCRRGNHQDPLVMPKNPDQVSGYYKMAPQSYSVCTLLSTDSQAKCASQSTNLIPSDPQFRFTTPSALILSDLESGDGRLYRLPDVNGSYRYTPVVIDQNAKTFRSSLKYDPGQLWYNDFNCTWVLKMDIDGKYQDFQTPQTLGDYKLRGNISQTAFYSYALSPNCTSELQAMKSCYFDENTCGGESDTENHQRHEEVAADFQMYFDANVLDTQDLPKLQAFGYQITY